MHEYAVAWRCAYARVEPAGTAGLQVHCQFETSSTLHTCGLCHVTAACTESAPKSLFFMTEMPCARF